MPRALIADIGGTHTRLELWNGSVARTETQRSMDHGSAEAAFDAFLGGDRELDAMVIAIAGPVEAGVCKVTNLPWVLDERALSSRYGAPARLLNDFEAAAYGIDTLEVSDLAPLQAGERDPGGTIALLGAGTGLGEALIVRETGGSTRVLPTEGGHAEFGPWDERSDTVLRRLRGRYGHVSIERVASGMGLAELFDIVRHERWATPNETTLAALGSDPGAAIGAAAKDDPAARLAVELFSRALGAEAGNLALKSLPKGGVRIAGGIAPKLLRGSADLFRDPFLTGFLDKGRMRPLLERLAVDVVLAPDLGQRGARRLAALLSAR